MSARIGVLVGRGRYEDPWHDHAATGHLVALEAHALGHAVELVSTTPGAVRDLLAGGPDVVVVNAGRGRVDPGFDGDDAAWAPDHAALAEWADAGGRILGLHCAANAFADAPQWERLLGGRWVPGTSWHPPSGPSSFVPRPGHPLADAVLQGGPGAVTADDERYCDLVVGPDSAPTLVHEQDGRAQVAGWALSTGARRAVYDGLGHSTASYASPTRRRLLRLELAWLLAGRLEGRLG